jgi:RIO kinase 2
MKLDPTVMRTMNRQDFRVLNAVEAGMKDRELVPVPLINTIANLRHGGTNKIISSLLRDKLLSHDQSCGYDGYRLTNSGYDILALHDLKCRGIIGGIGDRIGTGKESDVYLAITPRNTQIVLKFHRLGRTSFRDVKKKRDYFMVNALSKNKRGGARYRTLPNSWLFLSRTSALKEFAFMKALHDAGYPTPKPVGHSRHVVAMGLVRGVPLYQLHTNRVSAEQAQSVYEQSAILAGRLARHGLVHCDLNEFNLMVDLSGVQARIAGVGGGDGIGLDEDGFATLDGTAAGGGGRNWEDDATEHYVRHSGLPSRNRGALSSHGPLQKHTVIDGTGEVVTEEPPEPEGLLDNGEPRPIVTLIDFPQMVSTRHPNARELYERDVECLKRFFGTKLRCYVEGEGSVGGGVMPTWEELVAGDDDGGGEGLEFPGDGADDVTLVSKAQHRLDEELKASGYSREDAARDTELAYYEAHQRLDRGLDVVDDDDEEEDDDDDEEDDEEDEEGEDDVEGIDENDNANEEKPANEDEHVNDYERAPDLIDMDDFHIQSGRSNISDGASIAGGVSLSGMSKISQLSYAEAEQRARERVRRHLEDRKRASGKKGAFKTRNSNKSFSKGKRVITDFGV